MKYILIAFTFLMATSCSKQSWEIETSACQMDETINTSHSKAAQLQSIMDKYTKIGLPGVAIAIYSDEGWWAGASGYSKIETKAAMQPCHLQYSQSVAKTYMAVAILKLYEDGKINLDEKITKYLPEEITSKVTGAGQMTVRMLLNHTSGVAEYNMDPNYVSYLLQHPMHVFTSLDYLEYIDGDDLQFEPGSRHGYTNTNYLLLALIGDQLTGDHARYIRDNIFKPLGLVHSYYRDDANYLNNPMLVNSYWDRYSNSTIENCSEMQKVNVGSLIGDDGIIASPVDYVKFLRGIFEGQLMTPATLEQMLTFVQNDTAADAYGYGLGIHREYDNELVEYGHTGGGIGAGCELGYFPDKNLYFFISLNLGTIIDGPLLDQYAGIRDDVVNALTE